MIKKHLLAIILAVSAFFVSCNKEETDIYKGSYSFKTSGIIYARIVDPDSFPSSIFPETVTIKIPTESGQMDITPSGASGNEMIVSMNVMGGDLIVCRAKADSKSISILPQERNVVFTFPYLIGDKTFDVESQMRLTGDGQSYDGGLLLFKFRYSGYFSIGGVKYEVYNSDIDCRAKLNY